jgi:hypothetical protein
VSHQSFNRCASSKSPWSQLAFILLASLALRIFLAVRGGAFFGSDDSRYVVSRESVSRILSGHFRSGAEILFESADHLLFKVIGLVPALIERVTGESAAVPAIFFGAFSVVIILLTWRIVLEKGGSSTEALFWFFRFPSGSLTQGGPGAC